MFWYTIFGRERFALFIMVFIIQMQQEDKKARQDHYENILNIGRLSLQVCVTFRP